jgi:predicted DNA-binding mobile mystery protein A
MKRLLSNQIDRFLSHYDEVKKLPTPNKGWVKYIRNALGMTAEQLARRLGVSRRRVVALEHAELDGGITLKSLNEAASALNCKFIYAIVPQTSIEQITKEQARKFVEQHLVAVSHNMALEAQSVRDKKAIEAQIDDLVQQYLSKSAKKIWDD